MKTYIAGHGGMVGGAIHRKMLADDIGGEIVTRTHAQLDLTYQQAVRDFMQTEKPDLVIMAAARVGGIAANNEYPAEFIYENLMIQSNVINQAFEVGVQKLLQLGSSCIYPKFASQPMAEDALLTGMLEPTNEPYAIAKIAGIKLCESYNRQYGVDYRSAMPTNLYGPGDNYHPEKSHVLPALMRRLDEAAKNGDDQVVIWGTGSPKREFLHVSDLASAAMHILSIEKEDYQRATQPMLSHINVGTGQDVTIRQLAETIADTVGFKGKLVFDKSKPDGPPQKLLDVSRMTELGWRASITLEQGIHQTYEWYKEQSSVQLRES